MACTTRCISCFKPNRSSLISALIAILTLSLPGCSLILGTGRYAEVDVEEGLVISDLSTDAILHIDTSENKYQIRLRNGMRHALRVEKDSMTSYVFMSPDGSPLSMLNGLISFGIGFGIDHFTHSAFTYDRKFITSRPQDNVPPERRADIEDSLRLRLTPVVPTSLIDGRENNLVVLWGSYGIDFGRGFSSPFAVGAGVTVLPWIMPMIEIGTSFSGTVISAGIQAQEPDRGICAAYRYSWSSASTQYSISAGFFAQWYRFEFRFGNRTSSTSNTLNHTPLGWYFGVYNSLQVML